MAAQIQTDNVAEGWRGLRDTLNQRPEIAIPIAVVVALLFLGGGIFLATRHGGSTPRSHAKSGQFFSADDGATWFLEDTQEFPPILHQGKPAYHAFVVTNDDGKTQWVSYLERLSDDAKAKMDALHAQGDAADPDIWASTLKGGWEVKKPGDANWVKRTDVKAAAKVTAPQSPNGGSQKISPVAP